MSRAKPQSLNLRFVVNMLPRSHGFPDPLRSSVLKLTSVDGQSEKAKSVLG